MRVLYFISGKWFLKTTFWMLMFSLLLDFYCFQFFCFFCFSAERQKIFSRETKINHELQIQFNFNIAGLLLKLFSFIILHIFFYTKNILVPNDINVHSYLPYPTCQSFEVITMLFLFIMVHISLWFWFLTIGYIPKGINNQNFIF